MRVLFWSELFWPHIGGAEIFAAQLLPALKKRGYEFIVMTRQDTPRLASEAHYKGIPIYRFPFWTAFADHDVEQVMHIRRQVAKVKRTFAPQLIHIHGVGFSVIFHLDTANGYPAPLLVTLTQELPKQTVSPVVLKRVLHSANWVTVKAATMLTEIHQMVPGIISSSSVVHNGLDVPALPPGPLPMGPPRLLCLGRLTRQKGFDVALTAFAAVVGYFPHVRLTIAGDGPERENLERQMAELGLADKVDLIGWVAPDKIWALINSATMVIMPSRWEGLPSVALQAAMMARPLVAAPVGGLAEVVVHEETGLLVKPEDPKGLAEAIVFLLDRPEGARRMGQAARSRTQEVFDWKQCVDAYDALYRELGKRDAYVSAM